MSVGFFIRLDRKDGSPVEIDPGEYTMSLVSVTVQDVDVIASIPFTVPAEPEPEPEPAAQFFKVALITDGGKVADVDLRDGKVIPRSDFGATVVATPSKPVGSVRMDLKGQRQRLESAAPYTLFGDENGQLNYQRLGVGEHTLRLTAYAQNGGAGNVVAEQIVRFTVQ